MFISILLFSFHIFAFPVGKFVIGSSSLALSGQSQGLHSFVNIRDPHNGVALFNQNKHLKGDVGFTHQFLAIDCEMVGIRNNTKSALARVSIVDFDGNIVLDKYVKPMEPVSDYRSWISGIYPHHLRRAENFHKIRRQVDRILKDKIIIGHALTNDFNILKLSVPDTMIRDTSKYHGFKKYAKVKNNTPGLKTLAENVLGFDIQTSSHDSVEDARTAMLLFKSVMDEWNGNMALN